MNNIDNSTNQEIKKELPVKNVDHEFQPERSDLKENNQSNCQNCNTLKNKI